MIRFSKTLTIPLVLALLWMIGCCEQAGQAGESGETIKITLLQLNDVYEIDGVGGGAWGGLDRVAFLRKQLMEDAAGLD